MVVRIDCDKKKHINFYEGNCVTMDYKEGTPGKKDILTLVVEGRKDSVTVEIREGQESSIYIMNDQGKTIERTFI